MGLEIGDFATGFVAKLVANGTTVIHPKSIEDRQGFSNVVSAIDGEIRRLKNSNETDGWYKDLVRLRNILQASNTGYFDNFEGVLQKLQFGFTSRPNPFYEDIVFGVSKQFAESFVRDSFEDQEQKLLELAARAFLDAKDHSHSQAA